MSHLGKHAYPYKQRFMLRVLRALIMPCIISQIRSDQSCLVTFGQIRAEQQAVGAGCLEST
eukprot:5601524-Pleurochrysis_carterae.AAC.1